MYAVFELIPVKKLRENISWFWWKFGLLFFGSISSWVAIYTGEMAAEIIGESQVAELHSAFGNATGWFFSILAVLYIISGIERGLLPHVISNWQKYSVTRAIWKVLLILKKLFLDTPLVYIVALVGLALITITGALGGAVAFGPDVDPVVSFVYNFFF